MNFQHYMNYINLSFIETFTEKKFPKWKCPHCQSGFISLKENSLQYSETKESVDSKTHDAWEPDWIDYRFIATFVCPACKHETYCCGKAKHYFYQPTDYGEGELSDEIVFTPTHFEPVIHLIPIPEKCPEYIKKALIGSFTVAWANISAGCNRLRVSIERLTEEINPKLSGTLHEKLKKLSETNSKLSSLLMAIKWLGNDASHDENLRECDLAFGYKVMKNVLYEIFENEESELHELAAMVNKARGAPGKT